MNFDSETASDFLQSLQTGVVLETEFVKLVKFVADSARLCRLLLREIASFTRSEQALLKPFRGRFPLPITMRFHLAANHFLKVVFTNRLDAVSSVRGETESVKKSQTPDRGEIA